MLNEKIPQRQIIILGAGGTIAGKAASTADNVGYAAAQIGVQQLLDAIPTLKTAAGVAEFAGCELTCEQVAQIDSKDMGFAVWQQLMARCSYWLSQAQVQGIVITHGTDTLEETAYFLQASLNPAKPIVITCAMRPATALAPDGPQNMLDALALAAHTGAHGVTAVCAGSIHSAIDVQKVHTYRLDAFDSGDAGRIGVVQEGCVSLYRNFQSNMAVSGVFNELFAINNIAKLENLKSLPRVEIVMNHAGSDGSVVEALLAQKAKASVNALCGIVVAATGNGTISAELERALRRAEAEGVVVWRSTRCAFGQIIGKASAEFGDSGGLSPVKARIALQLHLLG